MTNFYRAGDSISAGDSFCGGGGASAGLLDAGVELRFAANHDAYAIATHAANHPDVDHFKVDLLEYDVAKLPRVSMAHFSPSCKHHSQANANKVYEDPTGTLPRFVLGEDGEEIARSGYANSERSRTTMSCVLRYAAVHQPETMIVENVVEAAKWGPNRDGSTFAWWMSELDRLGYETRPMFLNSVAFGVPQSRDRMFVVCWRKGMRAPNLDHWVKGWCSSCEAVVDAFQWFRKPTKAWPMSEWGKLGKQYDYACDSCCTPVQILHTPIASVLDFGDLGQRIGDRDKPLAASTIGRIQRYLDMHDHKLPAVMVTASADHGGAPRWAGEPGPTFTTRHEQALLQVTHAAQVTVYGNTHERPGSTCRGRSVFEPTWTQHTTEAYGLAFRGGVYDYQGGDLVPFDAAGRTHTASETFAIAGSVVPFRRHTAPTGLDEPTHTQTSEQVAGLAFGAMWAKQNGGPADTAYHPTSDPANTFTAKDTTAVSFSTRNGPVNIDDIYFRMMQVREIQGAMAYPDDYVFASPDGSEVSKRDKVRLLGDGVTPPVLDWLTTQTLEIMS